MGKSAPAPTPPKEVSAATTGGNVSTAIANAFLQNQNEVGPDGTKTFDQTGSMTYKDPYTGMTYTIPRFTTTTTLSPEQQKIKDQNNAASLNLASLGNNLSGTLGQQLTGNFSLDNNATESRLMDLGRQRLDPLLAQQDEALRSRLANQGIMAGSAAYDREMALQGQNRNDAYNQLLLTGRGQASQELLAQDNQRINQISALMGGGQVSQPNFITGSNVNPMNTTDNGAIIAQNDAQRMAQWQQSQAAGGSMLGGLGGLFSGGANSAFSGLMALSDERAKTDKHVIGETKDGMNIYSFKYKGSPKTEVGLMAQEVAKKKPKAVAKGADGLLRVNYAEALK